ncbi:MAG: PAS domain S-box protein [Archaeoglobaceae archaeon]|nr:PAS domain S-box protein [Archaeoglobaceae archaeon]MDW8117685.1 PAS domain S-box protein [Archaeoglobaceae archaeon]
MRIIVIRKREDLKDCDLALIDSEDVDLLREARKHSKFVVFLGKKLGGTEIFSKIDNLISEYEMFKSILEQIIHPIIIFDVNGVLYTNPKAKEYFGSELSKIEVLLDFLYPYTREKALEKIHKVLRGMKVEPSEELFVMPDGRKLWFESNFSLLNFKGKEAILLTLRDITEKKKFEEKLEESNKRYKEFFDNSLDIIAVTDLKGNFVEVNKAFEDAFGYTKEEVKGKNFAEVLKLGKEVAEEIFKSYNKAFREKRDLIGLVFEVKRRDGREIIVEGNIRLIREGSNVLGFIGNYRDVTDRIKLEKKLKESEERYRKIFENSPSLIALVDKSGIFIEANQAMVESIGENPVGKSHYDLFSKEVAERRINNMKKAIEEDKIISFQDEREGGFFFNQYIPIELEGKKHCLIIAQEITELLRLNNLLRGIALIGETLAIVRDREKLKESVEKILSDYSAKISEKPEGIYFPITYGEKNYGYLCVKSAGEEERRLLKTLADDLALVFKSIEDEERKQELYERLSENIRTIAYLIDGIRNPLAVMLAYVEMLIEDEKAKERVFQQIDRILRIMRELDVSWIRSEELTSSKMIQSNNYLN